MNLNIYNTLLFSLSIIGMMAACSLGTDTAPDELTGESISYELTATGHSEVSGTVYFAERADGFTRVTVELSDLPEGDEFPIVIHSGTVLQGGEERILLMPANENGISITNVYSDVDNQTVRYSHWEEMDAHIRIYNMEDAEGEGSGEILATADIGGNELTGEALSYDFEEHNESGITGSVEFFERNSGEILVLVELKGAGTDETYFARLYSTDEEEGEDTLIFTFSEIGGSKGFSASDLVELKDGTSLTFEDLDVFSGAVRIYSEEDGHGLLATALIEPEVDEEGNLSVGQYEG